MLGDPRTADPCALADASLYDRFGDAHIDRNYGVLNRCDVLIDVPGDALVDVDFEWDGPGSDEVGTVVRHPVEQDGGLCAIPVTLADKSAVDIVVKTEDNVEVDLCEVADVAADHALEVLGGLSEIPRRREPPDTRSLVNVDACSLLTEADLATVPAYAGAKAEPGFANWDCRWQAADSSGAVRIIFNLGDTTDSAEGAHQSLGGRDVYVEDGGYGDDTCAANVFHLRFSDEYGDPKVEHASVVADGGASMAQLCQLATTFASPVAERLPAL